MVVASSTLILLPKVILLPKIPGRLSQPQSIASAKVKSCLRNRISKHQLVSLCSSEVVTGSLLQTRCGAHARLKMAGTQPKDSGNSAPADAKDAVFVTSDPLPEGAIPVHGIDFNRHKENDISVVDLVDGMSSMGFQASAVGDAVRIINEMVRRHL